jgi:hypothetical protein
MTAACLLGCGRFGFAPDRADASDGSPSDGPNDALIDAPPVMLEAGECPANYSMRGSGCYRWVTTPAEWLIAEQACESDAVGAHLVIVGDASEALVLDGPGVGEFWTGVTDRVNPGGNFLTVTGVTASYFAWSPGEPDRGTQNCVNFDGTQTSADRLCATQLDYYCEYDGMPAQPSAY